jgi:hypothetical protein
LIVIAAAVMSCAGTEQRASATAPKQGSRFEGIGAVTLHKGQPCSPQIMFDLHVAFGSTIWLAAGVAEERLLIDAARRHQRVRLSGTWRRGRAANCSFVSVTRVGE